MRDKVKKDERVKKEEKEKRGIDLLVKKEIKKFEKKNKKVKVWFFVLKIKRFRIELKIFFRKIIYC